MYTMNSYKYTTRTNKYVTNSIAYWFEFVLYMLLKRNAIDSIAIFSVYPYSLSRGSIHIFFFRLNGDGIRELNNKFCTLKLKMKFSLFSWRADLVEPFARVKLWAHLRTENTHRRASRYTIAVCTDTCYISVYALSTTA